jgi:M6 family metalloprotease-like protein
MRKRLLKSMMLLVLMTIISIGAFAIPANKQAVTIRQPNGKTLTFVLGGDEYVNWATTLDQYTLVRNSEGVFTYGVLDENGDLVASKYIASNANERTAEEIAFLSTLPVNLFYSDRQVELKKQNSPASLPANSDAKYPSIGTVKLLVILVGFSDKPFTYTNQNFVDLVSADNYNGTGSVKDYYKDNSDEQFIMDIDVAGPYTLPNTMAYYGGNNAYGSDQNMDYFVRHAIDAANPDVDYADYDNDNDNRVDAIHIIFAGTPESSTGIDNEIWPHRSSVSPNIVKDNVRFGPYSCSAEKKNSVAMDGIGTICHEFGHVLGFPDFYDTDYTGSGGQAAVPGDWDLMSSGSYLNNSATPAGLTGIERQIANWAQPIELTTTANGLSLPAINDSAVFYKIDLGNNNEFLMLEHRRKTKWDSYIPGEGMLIYHAQQNRINNWLENGQNNINVTPSNRGWYIVPATGNDAHTETGNAPFPGISGNMNFTNLTTPANTLMNGTPTNKPITSIQYQNDSVITFNFMSDLPAVSTGAVTSSTITSSSAIVSGSILYYGDSTISEQGAVWSVNQEALRNLDQDSITAIAANTTDAVFTVELTGLVPSSTIYYRAYAESSTGTSYGEVRQFNTPSGLGTLLTQAASNIDSVHATIKGKIVNLGEGEFVEKGFIVSSDENDGLTLESSWIIPVVDTVTTGNYEITLDTLTEGMTYYFKAYLTTTLGTAYGTKRSFTTTFPEIHNNVISSDQAFCLGETPQLLTGSEPTGGRGNFTYQWQQKGRTGSWVNATQESTNQNYQPEAITDSTYYRRVVTSNGVVEHISNTVLLDVKITRGGIISENISNDTIALGDATGQLKLNNYRGTIIDWERSIDNQAWESLGFNQRNYPGETPTTEATYTYRVKVQLDQCPSDYSAEKAIYVKDYSSIQDVEAIFDYTVLPNPTAGQITITSDEAQAESLTITNVLGQEILKETNCNINGKVINLDSFESGIYFLNIKQGNKQSTKQIILKK